MTLGSVVRKIVIGVGVALFVMGNINIPKVEAVCVFADPHRVSHELINELSYCDTWSPTSVVSMDGLCGNATLSLPGGVACDGLNPPTEGCTGSRGAMIYECGSDDYGPYCYCQAFACDAACGGGGGGGGAETCGNGPYPQCNGTCSGGNVCKAIASTGSCNCGPPASCSEYVPQPNLISTVRISPTSARFRWSALNTTTYPYVERIALVVEDNASNFNTCKVAVINGTASANCNVYQPNLAVTSTIDLKKKNWNFAL